MKIRTIAKAGISVALALAGSQLPGRAQWAAPPPAADTIPAAQLLQPGELRNLLNAPGAGRPLILQVGSRVMFDQAHIVGAEFAGPGSRDEGLNLLHERVKPLAHNKFIVLYCGCCPWSRCPNVGAAYKMLRDMGFTRVKVLYMADNFGADWVSKGYPVAR